MLNHISLFGCIIVCLSSHLLRDLLRASWLLPCFGNYRESCCQALDNFEITQERRDRSIFTLGLVGCMSVICSHFRVLSGITSYPSAGIVPGMLVRLTAPAPLALWLRGAESHASLQLVLFISWSPKCVGGGGEARVEIYGARGQCAKISLVTWHCKLKIWFSSTPSWVEVLSLSGI